MTTLNNEMVRRDVKDKIEELKKEQLASKFWGLPYVFVIDIIERIVDAGAERNAHLPPSSIVENFFSGEIEISREIENRHDDRSCMYECMKEIFGVEHDFTIAAEEQLKIATKEKEKALVDLDQAKKLFVLLDLHIRMTPDSMKREHEPMRRGMQPSWFQSIFFGAK